MPSEEVVELIEACYAVSGSAELWLQGVADAARPVIGDGLGTVATLYSPRDGVARITDIALGEGVAPDALARFHARIGKGASPLGGKPAGFASWVDMPCAMVSSVPGLARILPALTELGALDMLALHGRDRLGYGVWIGAPLTRTGTLVPRRARLLARIAGHLANGYRLLRRVAGEGEPRVATAPDDRAALREEIVRVARVMKEPARLWKTKNGESRWALIDSFEHEGKSFIVASRDDSELVRPAELTPREREVLGLAVRDKSNKVIAHELGINGATVRVLLHRAMQKLGVATRAEVVARFRTTVA